MKLYEILEQTDEVLMEITAKQVIAAGALAAAALGIYTQRAADTPAPVSQVTAPKVNELEQEVTMLTQKVLKKFKTLDEEEVKAIVALVKKYEKPTFPKARDILALISIESSFDPNAVSGLKHDPAMGLLQVRPGVWDLSRKKLSSDVEYQISSGVDILHEYYVKYGNKDAAIQAFNIGETAYRKMHKTSVDKTEALKNKQRIESAQRYAAKFKDALAHFMPS